MLWIALAVTFVIGAVSLGLFMWFYSDEVSITETKVLAGSLITLGISALVFVGLAGALIYQAL